MSWLLGSRKPAITLQVDRPIRPTKSLPTQPATPVIAPRKGAGGSD